MIGIKLEDENEFLETEPDTVISIRLENPIFGDAEKLSPGSYSLPFNLPGGDRSPKNSQLLKNPDVIENAESYQIQKATLFWDGVPFRSGNLKPKRYANNSISSYFTFGLNALSADLKTAKLRDIIAETFIISSANIQKAVYIKPIGAGDRTITINGQAYTDDSISGIGVLINDYFTDNIILDGDLWLPRATLVAAGPNTPNGITPTYVTIQMARMVTDDITHLPTLQFSTDPHIELNVIGDYDQWEIEGDLKTYYADFDAFFATYVTSPEPNDKVRFPLHFNADMHDGEILKPVDVVNAYDTTGIRKNEPNFGQLIATEDGFVPRNYNSIQPFVLLKHVLDTIATAFGFEWEGDFYEDPDFATILLDNSVGLDIPMPFVGEQKFIFWRRSFDMAELVEDITVIDLLKKIQARYNLAVYFNDVTGKVRICYREPLAKSYTHEDITMMSSPVNGIDDNRVEGYSLIIPKDPDDDFSIEERIDIGTPEETITIEVGKMQRTKTAVIDGKSVTGPWVSRPISDKFATRVFHYIGIVDTGTYKYAGADITNGQDTLPTLYDLRHKYWLLAQRNRLAISVAVNFELRHLMEMDWELKRRFDRSNFFIKAIDFEMSNWRVRATNVELYTV